MSSLVAGQIVFLAHRQTRLYAEVIQVLEARQMEWVRPLALVSGDVVQRLGNGSFGGAIAASQDAPDMVWPLDQLQPALDTEVIPLLAQLSSKTPNAELPLTPLSAQSESLTVNEFVRLLWADHQAPNQDDALS